MITNYRQ